MTGPQVYALKCPNCGSALQVKRGTGSFACAHCASTLAMHTDGGTVSLEPLTAGIQGIQRNTDRTAAELAIKRLNEEIAQLEGEAARIKSDAREMNTLAGTQENEIRNGGMFFPFLFVSIIVFVVAMTAINGILDAAKWRVDSGLIALISGGLALAAWVYVLKVIVRGRERQITSVRSVRDERMVTLDGEIASIDARLRERRERLVKHREVAEA